MEVAQDSSLPSKRSWNGWITGSVLAVVLFALTCAPMDVSIYMEGGKYGTGSSEFAWGWPAVYHKETHHAEHVPVERRFTKPPEGWLAVGATINLTLSVACSALAVTLYGVLRDRRFSIRTLLWLMLLGAILLAASGALRAHNDSLDVVAMPDPLSAVTVMAGIAALAGLGWLGARAVRWVVEH